MFASDPDSQYDAGMTAAERFAAQWEVIELLQEEHGPASVSAASPWSCDKRLVAHFHGTRRNFIIDADCNVIPEAHDPAS